MENAAAPPMRARVRPLRLIALLTTLALVAYLAIGAVVAGALTVPRRVPLTGDPTVALGLPFEEARFSARGEAVELTGWFIPAPPGAAPPRAVILVHGKDGCRTCGFDGTMLQLAGDLQRSGLSILLIDLRGHGGSGEGRFTFGLRERHDIQGAVDWLLARGFAPGRIGLLGESMGAASAIGAAADEPAIGALVADSSYAELLPVLQQEFPKASGLPAALLPGAVLMGRLFVGEDIGASRPVDEIGRIAPRPVLIIHAAGDDVIGVDHAARLGVAAGVTPWVIDGDSHTDTYTALPDAYAERAARFFAEALR
jgi:fermentation-respiration switch protein FrsA (DUF1100 family)